MSEGRGIPRFFVSFYKKRKGGFYFGSFSKRTPLKKETYL
jgi:hypothetical protein